LVGSEIDIKRRVMPGVFVYWAVNRINEMSFRAKRGIHISIKNKKIYPIQGDGR